MQELKQNQQIKNYVQDCFMIYNGVIDNHFISKTRALNDVYYTFPEDERKELTDFITAIHLKTLSALGLDHSKSDNFDYNESYKNLLEKSNKVCEYFFKEFKLM